MYAFHANALGLGGKFTRPLEQVIESQASSSLASSGGFGSGHAENFNFKNIISFRLAHTQVAGSHVGEDENRIHTTRSSALVEGLNVLNVVTADKVIARLAGKHPHGADEPEIVTTGSYFENLKIAGFSAVVEFSHSIFHRFSTHQALEKAFKDKKTRQEVLDCMLGSRLKVKPEDPQHLRDVQRKFEQQKAADDLHRFALCSIVKNVKLMNGDPETCKALTADELEGMGIRIFPPFIIIARFGTVSLGEVTCSNSHKRLNMLRLELGSPDEASIIVGGGDGNGGGYP